MTVAELDDRNRARPLRLWPGVVVVALQWLAWILVPVIFPDAVMISIIGGVLGGFAVFIWWAFFSRVPWGERLGVIALIIAALAATPLVLDKSVATGMRGKLFFIYVTPVLSLALVLWAVFSRRLSKWPRRALLAALVLVACGAFTLLRTEGVTGKGSSQFAWRWSETHEERLLAASRHQPAALLPAPARATVPEPPPAAPTTEAPAEVRSTPAPDEEVAFWPGFRGPERNGVIRGIRIKTDWSASPPVELWRRPVGPGWSSFAVRGDLIYTQEQRGEEEAVSCYRLSTGEPVWSHRDPVRFWESNAGAGPRGTPTLHGGRVYAFGATGVLNALDAGTGAVVWSRNVATDSNTEVPGWGFASSPLVIDDSVIVAASGTLAAYDLANGNPRWFGEANGGGYSSPHLATIGGVRQVLLLSGNGAIGVNPADGRNLWEHSWPGAAVLQPAVLSQGDLLITTSGAAGGLGTRRIAVTRASTGWSVEERWTSIGLKPYFNDFVVHNGHAFGFDGRILSCIDLQDGKRKWKGGRYGNGQLVLLTDQNLLLVLSEEGELALVSATPDQFTELARFPAIEGKTWNHPALSDNVLLVRNGEQMAAFRLSLADR